MDAQPTETVPNMFVLVLVSQPVHQGDAVQLPLVFRPEALRALTALAPITYTCMAVTGNRVCRVPPPACLCCIPLSRALCYTPLSQASV